MIAAGAGVLVVGLSYALFAAIRPAVGPAWAALIVALLAAAIPFLVAGLLFAIARTKRPAPPAGTPTTFAERIMAFLREKPVVAVSTALAAGFMAVRNPGYLGAAIRSFLEGREPPKRGR
jgi:hypothetical protein